MEDIIATATLRLSRHSGRNTTPSASTAIRSAAITNTVTSPLLLVVGRRRVARCAPAHEPGDDEATGEQHQRRTEPQQPGTGFDLWAVQHEFAVARDEEILDLRVRLALAHEFEHFVAQVARDLRVGVGQRLVLA